ncbi:carbohydrate ABC transporter permease [Paenarthrobacter aurescens]|uniref:Sugar ABC transporter permease n=1 Tax=Paenarthrobacter aurescens TaxID=43663 RepID=A0A4Y3NC67_PAEAU|nr:sugar ABC transporter permease [Paenarthrobacter aurescens]MDO6144432.1 sugar ABC transporter permease [Paenarthrobacter aurescens]MDO6148279.1 sugar ABC transporter permease [Paenarthrobacter aurescens]MDO6159523.1 sugar ABC transporter permease [Paenarthrobacter aurescens]MDO6163506.1 sugar ABC transporter permease [Paenarthrobacter aurescens]GEB17995.1 sugar ABC transporter permease [Paenarthrobacter aurescens]
MTTTRTAPTVQRPAAPAGGGKRNGAAARAPWLLLAPFLGLFVLTFLLPIVVAIMSSFTKVTRNGLFGEAGVTSEFAGFSNYAQALADGSFVASIGRMLLFGVVQVPVMIVLCTALALMLESASAKWPGFFRAAYFLPYGVPGVIATILWSFLYVPGLSPLFDVAKVVGLTPDFLGANSVLWSIANIVTWSYTGYNMLIIVAQLKAIPVELYEAAKVDGASTWRVARSIQLPLIRPALMLTTVFSIIGTLQLFAEAQVLKTVAPAIDSQYTPNLSAYTTAFAYNDYNVAAAQSVIIAVAAFALSFAFLALTNRKSS